ncbi:MAG: asparagine synthase (glutamine-hydrolyzing), partial [Oscillospiraceae bacterium]|nr:asparagine synthase (glutamine-hydrolyzing) [Oscillospiraceae bacterium]
MCGFVGFFHKGEYDPDTVLHGMTERIRHRGPDGEGYYRDERIAMGFRRLSVIDIEGGAQPIGSEDGSYVLTFNGEIYNYRELREELAELGHIFKSLSDSEVLLHGYEQYGADILGRLRGMYAFVIWDRNKSELFGARDIFGIKPLYYYKNNGEFLYASEIKAFLEHPRFEKKLNEARLPEYMCYEYIPGRETMFLNVFELLNGEYFICRDEALTIHKYFDAADYFKEDPTKTQEEWENLISKTFTESVRAHMIADVEVGCFLSGGVDSGYAAGEAARVTPNIKTFSVGYEEEKYNELHRAEELAAAVGVENIANKISAEDFFSAARDILYYLDEPLPNPSEVPLYFVSENASKYVKVVLSGEGADELFGGYYAYQEGARFARYEKIPLFFRRATARLMKRLPDFKGKRFIIRGAMPPWQRFGRAGNIFDREERWQYLLNKTDAPDPADYARSHFERVSELDEPSKLQYADLHTWLLHDINVKADRMSMAHSLELRVPFLDKCVMALAAKIPPGYKIKGHLTKFPLREAANKTLPDEWATRKKIGFYVPVLYWLREEKYYK